VTFSARSISDGKRNFRQFDLEHWPKSDGAAIATTNTSVEMQVAKLAVRESVECFIRVSSAKRKNPRKQ
jgi:hypothetical protein